MPARLRLTLLLFLLLLPACDLVGGEEEAPPVAEVDLEALFAPPTAAERAAVLADWAARTPSAEGVEIVSETTLDVGSLVFDVRVIAHEVGSVRHYGLVLVPPDAAPASRPVLVYAHGGDSGIALADLGAPIALGLGAQAGAFVYVVPSFRSEPLRVDGVTYVSDGPASPWDGDVDDTLALLDAALATTPAADADRIGILGFSRGAGVALLAAVRDPRIDLVVDYFGPTDFFGPYVQAIVEDALQGQPRDLPGVDFLNETYVGPLRAGTVTVEAVRLELLRRSPVYFAERLPAVLAHHGLADTVVDPSQTEALAEAMAAIGREAPDFQAYFYPGMGHFPDLGTFTRTADFLGRLVE